MFFFEAISENNQLKKFGAEALKQEIKFLEKFFVGLKKHHKLPKESNTALLAECLHFLVEGAGTIKYFTQDEVEEEDWIEMYYKNLKNFFNIIK